MNVPQFQRLDQLEAFLQRDPANLRLRTDAVHAALAEGQLRRAADLAQDLDPAIAARPEMLHLQATVLLAKGEYAQARELLEEVVRGGIDAPAVLFNLGYASFRGGDAEAAVKVLRSLLDHPEAPDGTLSWLLRSLHRLNQLQEAAAIWNAAATRTRTPEAVAVASLVFLDIGDANEARKLADTALARGSAHAEAFVARATLAIGDGDGALATKLLTRAQAEHREDGRIFATVGTARLAGGDLTGAEKAFRQAVALMPQHVGTWHALAWCQLLSKNLDAARASFNTALALDRNFGETYGGLAVVEVLRGNVQAAQDAIARAARLNRDGMAYRYAQALLSGEARDVAQIRNLAARLLHRQPDAMTLGLVKRLGP